jgi:tight adherence protein B
LKLLASTYQLRSLVSGSGQDIDEDTGMSLTTILLIGGIAAFFLLITGIIVTVTSERSLVEERLGRYLEEESDLDRASDDSTGSGSARDWVEVRVERFRFGGNISKELARADIKLRASEYLMIVIGLGLVFMVIGYYFGHQSFLSYIFAVGGLALGYYLPRFYVRRQQNKRLQNFVEQLPDMLNLAVNGLRAGYSTMQALEAVSKELPSPISDEFRRVVQEMQLGIPMEIALDNLMRRIPSDDLDLIVTAMNVQREVGGNLAEILDVISFTIRERIRIKREIQVLVSQVLYSGRVLAFMPIALSGILYVFNPTYLLQLTQNGICGYLMIITATVMVGSGYYAMTKIADIEV